MGWGLWIDGRRVCWDIDTESRCGVVVEEGGAGGRGLLETGWMRWMARCGYE